MPLPSVPPPVVAACPFPDVAQARLAGDSAGRRASAAGHVLVGIASGFVGGVTVVPAASGTRGAVTAVAATSLAAAGINWAVAAHRSSLPAGTQSAIADCDSTVRTAYAQAYALQAKHRRGLRALWSGVIAFLAGVAAIVALVITALSSFT